MLLTLDVILSRGSSETSRGGRPLLAGSYNCRQSVCTEDMFKVSFSNHHTFIHVGLLCCQPLPKHSTSHFMKSSDILLDAFGFFFFFSAFGSYICLFIKHLKAAWRPTKVLMHHGGAFRATLTLRMELTTHWNNLCFFHELLAICFVCQVKTWQWWKALQCTMGKFCPQLPLSKQVDSIYFFFPIRTKWKTFHCCNEEKYKNLLQFNFLSSSI